MTKYKEYIFSNRFENSQTRERNTKELSSLVLQLSELVKDAICIEETTYAPTPEHYGSATSIKLAGHVLVYNMCNQFGYNTRIVSSITKSKNKSEMMKDLLESYKKFYGSEPKFRIL